MIAPNQVYKGRSTDNPIDLEDRYGFKRCLAVVKAAVPVIDVANLLCGPGSLRRVNTHWVGRCPLPDHDDNTPSFVVYPANNSWWCFGCSRGSDVLDLYQWQKTKSDIRDVAEAARKEVRRRRLFKYLVLTGPEFEIEDPNERRAAVERAWKVFESGMRRIGQ